MINTFSLTVEFPNGKVRKYTNLSRTAFYKTRKYWIYDIEDELMYSISEDYSPFTESLTIVKNQRDIESMGYNSKIKPPTNFM